MPRELGSQTAPERADVAVVGAGYTGLRAARVLADAGARVVVFESGGLASGASSRNGGQALIGLRDDGSALAARLGLEPTRRLWESSRAALRAIPRICADDGFDCDFDPCASIYLAAKPAHLDEMDRESEWLAKYLAHERVRVAKDDAARETGSEAFFGGVMDRESASLHPAKWARGLALAAFRAGVVLCANTTVDAIEAGRGGHTLRHAGGVLRTPEVLVATNGYTGSALPGLRRRVLPLGSSIIATEPLSRDLRKRINPKGRVFFDSHRSLVYFRLSPDGRLVLGGRTSLSHAQHPERTATRLRSKLTALYPALGKTRVTHCWSGRVGVSFDGLPHIGRIRGVRYALGYCGHGVALSTYLGEQAAEIMTGKRHSSVFAEIPHPTRFYYRRRAWFRPALAAGSRWLDWIS